MRRSTPILLSVTVLLVVSLACSSLTSIPVTAPSPDANALATAIMQTVVAAATQTAGAVVPVDIVSSPLPTFTPTSSPTATLSPTPSFTDTPVSTNTPTVPLISVSTDTNCRTGPGKTYDRVGALMIGETAEMVARDPTGRYWYIRNPDRPNELCWLWTEYATFSGNVGALPIYTPPPTPTPVPDFEAVYEGVETCVGWWINLELTNTSGIPFKSVALTVKDQNTGDSRTLYADKFTALEGCHSSATKDVLNPGERFTLSSPTFAYDLKGHKLRATITMCSEPGQNGTCVTKTIKLNI